MQAVFHPPQNSYQHNIAELFGCYILERIPSLIKMMKKNNLFAYTIHVFVLAAATASNFGTPLRSFTNVSPISSRLFTPIIIGVRSAITPRNCHSYCAPVRSIGNTYAVARGGAVATDIKEPPKFLTWAYVAAGAATMGAWSTMVYTTIRSNQPPGTVMPSPHHGFFARMVSNTS